MFGSRLLGTPNEQVWPGVSKLPNWHEYPQWNPSKVSDLVHGLDADALDLLEVCTMLLLLVALLDYFLLLQNRCTMLGVNCIMNVKWKKGVIN